MLLVFCELYTTEGARGLGLQLTPVTNKLHVNECCTENVFFGICRYFSCFSQQYQIDRYILTMYSYFVIAILHNVLESICGDY